MDVVVAVFATTFGLSWIVHFLGYYFLEMIYNKDPFPIVIPGITWFSPYNKTVKPKHEWIKRLTDFTLKMIGINFVLGILFGLLVFFFNAGR